MRLKDLLSENNVPVYKGDIDVPKDWKDLSRLPEIYPGYTPGCRLEGNFSCANCASLTSLEGAPTSTHDFYCLGCTSLISLEGAPTSTHKFYCGDCTSLISLEGAPTSTRNFYCNGCTSLISLKGAPTSTHSFYCDDCTSLTSLKGIGKDYLKEIDGAFWVNGSGIKSNVLGLLQVSELKSIKIGRGKLDKILNRHLKTKDILECQEELIEAGLKEFAKL